MVKLRWEGQQALQEAAAHLTSVLDQFNLRVDAAAKQQLYPGHGKDFGTLQRSIQTIPARREGMRVVGGVKTAGVPYARVINRRYRYMEKGLEKARPSLAELLRKR